jgi:hypothetical protein
MHVLTIYNFEDGYVEFVYMKLKKGEKRVDSAAICRM